MKSCKEQGKRERERKGREGNRNEMRNYIPLRRLFRESDAFELGNG